MKWIKYNMKNSLLPVKMPWTEANEAIAKAEAHNGEITPLDDGLPDPAAPENSAPTWDELAAALQEGVDAV